MRSYEEIAQEELCCEKGVINNCAKCAEKGGTLPPFALVIAQTFVLLCRNILLSVFSK